jgi:hypothetical protein
MAAFADEAGALQDADMARHRGPAYGELIRKFSGGALTRAQRVQNRAAGGICDGAETAGRSGKANMTDMGGKSFADAVMSWRSGRRAEAEDLCRALIVEDSRLI